MHRTLPPLLSLPFLPACLFGRPGRGEIRERPSSRPNSEGCTHVASHEDGRNDHLDERDEEREAEDSDESVLCVPCVHVHQHSVLISRRNPRETGLHEGEAAASRTFVRFAILKRLGCACVCVQRCRLCLCSLEVVCRKEERKKLALAVRWSSSP